MIMKKLVNIEAKSPVRTITPPLMGTHYRIELTPGEILKCICARALVDEILPNGKLIRLDLGNYNTENYIPVKEEVKKKEEIKDVIPEPVPEETCEPVEEVKEEVTEAEEEVTTEETVAEEETTKEEKVEEPKEERKGTTLAAQQRNRNTSNRNTRRKK